MDAPALLLDDVPRLVRQVPVFAGGEMDFVALGVSMCADPAGTGGIPVYADIVHRHTRERLDAALQLVGKPGVVWWGGRAGDAGGMRAGIIGDRFAWTSDTPKARLVNRDALRDRLTGLGGRRLAASHIPDRLGAGLQRRAHPASSTANIVATSMARTAAGGNDEWVHRGGLSCPRSINSGRHRP
jgi:hypothetical protein